MENTIVLKGTEEVVKIVGLEEIGELGKKAIECLNENYELECLVTNGQIEIEQGCTEDHYIIENCEYLVFKGEDKAREKAIQDNYDFLDEENYDDYLVELALRNNFIEISWFKDFWEEINREDAWDEYLEEFATEEQLKDIELGLITEEEVRIKYEENLNARVEGNWIEEYISVLGKEDFYKIVIREDLINLDNLVEYIVKTDGIAHTLATYDREELTHNNIYMYRVN